ncbi:electron transfer flavoprotein [Ignatzschineria indica]|uniref:Electron transfer flavoprotein-ubiquinone oxidoreductase n=1 Tax=Ignatzschineria indica TaxID=472583 RepID=A0A2U2AJ32_9GAMM|nr:electron transfer flavoprotein-ubiquinone oxidoreductase [Ignatzschineria indica]PWD82636.1 electron transfer flavoprotein-ubiquinone oxidoreductase [Ignatzschineria indica]GGZ85484.1 electron transfer flavoprotein [Ignatzschineria indica]
MRESIEFDVVIVGAGPAGLSAAIKIKQESVKKGQELSVCVVEKGSEIGAHALSGAVLDLRSLDELFPNWKELGAPVIENVTKEKFLYLTSKKSWALPVPPVMRNQGNAIISLGLLVRWLGEQAEKLGVEVYPGFSATEIIYQADGSVKGIATGDMGLDSIGNPTSNYMQGIELHAQQTIFAEGCRGSLSQEIIRKFALDKDSDPQTYGLGIKEIWEIDSKMHREGEVVHTIGWPLDNSTYGGTFIYHLENNQIAVGMVVGLDYKNPYLSPFEEFQRFKLHPQIKPLFEKGKRIAYGARALVEGGIQSLPSLSFKGGMLIGDSAGFLNVPKIKGIHMAMKSGMLAAEAIVRELQSTEVDSGVMSVSKIIDYEIDFKKSWAYKELWKVRNIRPSFKYGLFTAMLYSGLEDYFLKGRGFWTFKHVRHDHETLKEAMLVPEISYPKPDGVITFDRASSVYLTNIAHRENQPNHLQLGSEDIAIKVNYDIYQSPETRYCPVGVYEILQDAVTGSKRLQINAQNCIHCKTCDIKDPTQNIRWSPPEGGSGPNYSRM